jgi:hypothetical protein
MAAAALLGFGATDSPVCWAFPACLSKYCCCYVFQPREVPKLLQLLVCAATAASGLTLLLVLLVLLLFMHLLRTPFV